MKKLFDEQSFQHVFTAVKSAMSDVGITREPCLYVVEDSDYYPEHILPLLLDDKNIKRELRKKDLTTFMNLCKNAIGTGAFISSVTDSFTYLSQTPDELLAETSKYIVGGYPFSDMMASFGDESPAVLDCYNSLIAAAIDAAAVDLGIENIFLRDNLLMILHIMFHVGVTIWLECDGITFNPTNYSRLSSAKVSKS